MVVAISAPTILKLKINQHYLVLGDNCGCKEGALYADGVGRPEYTSIIGIALQKILSHIEDRTLFWGVHLRGRHVLDVQNGSGKSLSGRGG